MADASIPVDLHNPGQVFACLGFLEAAEILHGNAEGGFDWSEPTEVSFVLCANSERNPIEAVLSRIVTAELTELLPTDWPGKLLDNAIEADEFPSPMVEHYVKQDKKWSTTKLPLVFTVDDGTSFRMSHWTDGSSRAPFKLYSGNRSACSIARGMLFGKSDNSANGVKQLVANDIESLTEDPFNQTCPIGGSFNFDPRGGWTQIDAGFSINRHDHINVVSSPVVEILAAIGLEHSRPGTVEAKDETKSELQRYAAWNGLIPLTLARAAISGANVGIPARCFRYRFAASGKNKVNTFSTEEI